MFLLKIVFDLLALFLSQCANYNFRAALRNRDKVMSLTGDAEWRVRFVVFWTGINCIALICFVAAGIGVWFGWKWGAGLLVAPFPIALVMIVVQRLQQKRRPFTE